MRGLGSAALAAARLFGGIEKGKLQGAQRAREEVNARKAEADAEQRAMLDEMVKRSTVGRNEAETAEQLRATGAAPKTFAELLDQQERLERARTTPTPRSIDSRSPEGIAADVERARRIAAAEAPYRESQAAIAAEASARGRRLGGPPTEGERKAAFLYPRTERAAETIKKYTGREGSPPPKSKLGRIPLVGNYFLTPEEQKLNQAGEVVANAVLRMESGAVINKDEIRKKSLEFLPQPGDSPEVLEEKAATLRQTLTDLKRAQGRAAEDAGQAQPIRVGGTPSSGSDDLYKKYGIEPRRP